ncbi:hypothetical protein LCGC14_0641720 [marine sediment metagenome]|uniref:Uncharacterized protein n=1 Tax=marine sediment metagenome TaxID=412755 RepID=A0A0F9R430_9ZZZZ
MKVGPAAVEKFQQFNVPGDDSNYHFESFTFASGKLGTAIKANRGTFKAEVLESMHQIKSQETPAGAGADADVSVSAIGNAQGAGFAVVRYYNVVDSATGGSADSLDLAAAIRGDVHMIVNDTAIQLQMYPASGEKINDLADDAAFDIDAFTTVIVGCLVDGVFKAKAI